MKAEVILLFMSSREIVWHDMLNRVEQHTNNTYILFIFIEKTESITLFALVQSTKKLITNMPNRKIGIAFFLYLIHFALLSPFLLLTFFIIFHTVFCSKFACVCVCSCQYIEYINTHQPTSKCIKINRLLFFFGIRWKTRIRHGCIIFPGP